MVDIMSLCTGYGGLDLAVESVFGGRTRWVSDTDKDASDIEQVRFPDAVQLGDLTQICWADYAGQVDVLTAGYPCQPFSQAGRQRGVEDARHIWPWIAEGISGMGPAVVVLENVQGHLRLGFDVVLADLAAMGRTVRWGVVRASDAGAPHRRARLFVVAVDPNADGFRCERSVTESSWDNSGNDPRSDVAAVTDSVGLQRVETGDSKERSLGFVSGCDVDGRSMAAANPSGQRWYSRSRLSGQTERASIARCYPQVDWQQFAPAVERWERIMGRSAPPALVDGTKRLNAQLVEWMMGLPEGWVTDLIPNRRALKILGNGVVPQQAELAIRMLLR